MKNSILRVYPPIRKLDGSPNFSRAISLVYFFFGFFFINTYGVAEISVRTIVADSSQDMDTELL